MKLSQNQKDKLYEAIEDKVVDLGAFLLKYKLSDDKLLRSCEEILDDVKKKLN